MSVAPVGALVPIAVVWLILRRTSANALGIGISATAACGLGLGLSSTMLWALIQIPGAAPATLVIADSAMWITALLFLLIAPAIVRRRGGSSGEARSAVAPTRIVDRPIGVAAAIAVFLPLAILAATTFAALSAVLAHGSWDAWAIWNARARFLFLGVLDVWRDAFSPAIQWSQPDYPLLLPLSIARLWTFIGDDTVVVPIAIAACFGAGIVAVAGLSVARARAAATGWLTAAFIVANPAFVSWTSAQGADVGRRLNRATSGPRQ